MGINWYKIAGSDFLTPEDVFIFYAFMSSPEAFSDRNALISVAEKMNYMRELYIKALLKQIAEELDNVINIADRALKVERRGISNSEGESWPFISYREWKDRGQGVPEESEYIFDTYNAYVDYVKNTAELSPPVKADIEELVNRLMKGTVSHEDFDKAIDYFLRLPWNTYYGGNTWVNIVRWTERLMKTPPVDIDLLYKGEIKRAIEQMRRLGYVLDIINSIEHNTGMIMRDLPDDKGQTNWLTWVLDFVKNAPSPLGVAYFGGDMDVAREVKRNLMVSPWYRRDYSNMVNFLLDVLPKMPPTSADEFLHNIKDVDLIIALAEKLSHDSYDNMLLYHLLRNPILYIETDDKTLIDLMKKMMSAMGKSKFCSLIGALIRPMRPYLSPTVYEFLRSLNDRYVNEKLDDADAIYGR